MHQSDFSTLQVAIIGAGLMGHWHAHALRKMGVTIVAILDSDSSAAAKLAKSINHTSSIQLFTDIESLLQTVKLDVIHICTPVDSHYTLALEAIKSGINIVLEKPVASNLNETQVLLSEASKNKVTICPVHQFGFQDGVKKALSSLESLGDLLHLRFSTNSAGAEGKSVEYLNEVIADIIPHPLSVLQQIHSDINFQSENWSGVHSRKGELQLIGDIDNIGIDIYISMNARPTRCEMELFCTKGRVLLNFFHGYAVIEKGKVSKLQKLAQPFKFSFNHFLVASLNIIRRALNNEKAYPGLYSLLSEYYQSILNKVEPPISETEIISIAKTRDEVLQRFIL